MHQAKRAGAIAAGILGMTVAAGCPDDTRTHGKGGDDSEGGGGSSSSSQTFERIGQSSIDKVDLLLAIDNSRSMADKQEILAAAIPDLVKSLTNPTCVDEMTGAPTASQPAGPLEQCPVAGSHRSFMPVTDIHIGVISSSIGGHGADVCPNTETNSCGGSPNSSNNDKGHLLSRQDPCSGAVLETYQNKGFLAWDPAQKLMPPGEGDVAALSSALSDLVSGAGQIGCGYEAQLESWYRFLVDPEPYESISIANNIATPSGTDAALLAQRADFLRPDSLLTIVMLSDENDCSTIESGQFFLAGQIKDMNGMVFHLPRPRSECAKDPNDPCCKSCGMTPGNCPVDPTCVDANGNPKALTTLEDPVNLRCFEQKRRFGIDFLYPIDRYTQALTSPMVPNRKGDLVQNPLFVDLNPSDNVTGVRTKDQIVVAGIVGVPWQAIARDMNNLSKGFKSASELSANSGSGATFWDIILGDPTKYILPKDPYMIESIDPRSGTDPITAVPLSPPSAPNGANPINGHEYSPSQSRDDLQYACIFPLLQPRDCSAPGAISCDCVDGNNDNPLCDAMIPGDPRTLQTSAKAYPSLRELALLKSLGPQGVTTSICPAQIGDMAAADFGYRPAIGSIINRLSATLGGQCLAQSLKVDASGNVSCSVLEAKKVDPASVISCNSCMESGRQVATQALIDEAKKDPLAATAGWNCFCEVTQASGDDLKACQNDANPAPMNMTTNELVNGWCYVDAQTAPPVGNPGIVASCPEGAKHILRFVGAGELQKGSTGFLACSGS